MIFVLLLVTATMRPAEPAVGDLITVEFQESVVLDSSDAYELVSQEGNKVVVRTFRPQPFDLSGRVGNLRFSNLTVPVHSVLAPDDEMKPAPLKPPEEPAPSNVPWIALGSAAAAAALAWLALLILARRREREAAPVPLLTPAEEFRATVTRLRRSRQPQRWAALADATRRYLAAIDPRLGVELTTAEFLRAFPNENAAMVLRQGDLEKFSPWGTSGDFDRVAQRALELA